MGDVKHANHVGKRNSRNLKRRSESARMPPTLIAIGRNNRQNERGDEKKSRFDVSIITRRYRYNYDVRPSAEPPGVMYTVSTVCCVHPDRAGL